LYKVQKQLSLKIVAAVVSSDVARPQPPVFSRPRPLLQDQDRFFKTIKLLTQNLKKCFLTEKIRPVMPLLPSHADNRKKKNCLLPSSQVLLHPKLGLKI